MKALEYIELYGARVPVIGFGTWDIRGEEGKKAVLSALSLGYRHIDTAEFYDNEEQVGSAIRESGVPREEIFLTTKVWYTHLRRGDVIRSCETSLRKLGTDYVDLYLIHWPTESVPLEETIGAMEQLREAGKIRFLGVSNFDIPLLEKARQIAPSPVLTNQVECHPYLAQKDLVRYCQEKKVILTAYSPLARGRLRGDPVLGRIGKKYGKSPNQVALRWLIQQGMVAAIPKAQSVVHQKENLEIFDFTLTPEEMEEIGRLDRGEKVASRL
ncbi:MAG: aldo/keto reductase [Candidatus Caldatribacteriaceae bacterium]